MKIYVHIATNPPKPSFHDFLKAKEAVLLKSTIILNSKSKLYTLLECDRTFSSMELNIVNSFTSGESVVQVLPARPHSASEWSQTKG
ncbi:hypothetical protein J8J42_00200 [Chryseobacterium sp. cx-311]|uniref:hypothetical protein n=1 Tax=Marnyiella aurantia TaxID=2758037 RepID=UPI001AE624BE|nr:hypothetical protein [Marnyiella aurantia]MBP0611466.1 hypothetical protein [Marnyiella aurantia]